MLERRMLEKWQRLVKEVESEFLARVDEAARLHACKDSAPTAGVCGERPVARIRKRRPIVWKKQVQREKTVPTVLDACNDVPCNERENMHNTMASTAKATPACAESPDTGVSMQEPVQEACTDENLKLNAAFLQLKSQLAVCTGGEALFREKNLYRAAVINSLRRSPFRTQGFNPGNYKPRTVVPAIDSDDEVGMDVGFCTPLWAKDPRINERVRAQSHEELAQYFRNSEPINMHMMFPGVRDAANDSPNRWDAGEQRGRLGCAAQPPE